MLSTPGGEWLPVERVADTGQWHTVYNFRVSEYHTYFIAPGDVAFDVWVHNAYRARATDAGHAYEKRVRSLYSEATYKDRQFQTILDGKPLSGIADNVVNSGGKRSAIEAKYVSNWASSIRNPSSSIGATNFARAERRALVTQARAYTSLFDEVIYHSNSPDFINHYSTVFRRLGIEGIQFVHTP